LGHLNHWKVNRALPADLRLELFALAFAFALAFGLALAFTLLLASGFGLSFSASSLGIARCGTNKKSSKIHGVSQETIDELGKSTQ
jgi:hypothetical protein